MADASPLVLGIAGFGTVGSGLIRILTENREEIIARTGREVLVRTVLVRDSSRPRACPLPAGTRLTERMEDLFEDPAIDVVVELMGGVDAPCALVEGALKAGKHVVTANKALLAETGNRLFALAEEHKVHLAYEASVCGGIPIIQTLREGLAGNRIRTLMGILNGTSNYILSEMTIKGLPFAKALKEAQALGYAEADPTLDIEGFDAAHKLALLIRLAWGVDYPYADLSVKGITQVHADDIAYAREFGCRIKLIGHAALEGESLAKGGGISAGVRPTLVHEDFLLSRVDGAYNAVSVEGDAVGPLFLHGRGAGDLPTGSAVAADILTIARGARPNNTGFSCPVLPGPARIIPCHEARSRFYIRLTVTDVPGVLRDIAAIMAENGISIAQVIQKGQIPLPDTAETRGKGPFVPFIVMTHEAQTSGVLQALQTLSQLPVVHEPPVHYPVLSRQA